MSEYKILCEGFESLSYHPFDFAIISIRLHINVADVRKILYILFKVSCCCIRFGLNQINKT